MFLRFGKKSRWDKRDHSEPSDVETAMEDLSPRDDDEDVSVYRVETLDEAKTVAMVFALTRGGPRRLDAVLLPEPAFSLDDVAKRAAPELVAFLSERHYELLGLGDAANRANAAQRCLKLGVQVLRVQKGDVAKQYALLLTDIEVASKVEQGWAEYVARVIK